MPKRQIKTRPLRIVLGRTSNEGTSATPPPEFTVLGNAPVAPLSISEDPPITSTPYTIAITTIPTPPPTILFGERRSVRPASFPATLKIVNPNAWTALWTHLNTKSHVPVFVHGPTGCGKSRGVHDLVRHMGLRPVFIDAVEADDTNQLVTWVKRTREARTMKRQSVIILDDMEGFTLNARAELAKLSKDERMELNPMILICNARRDPMWNAFSKRAAEVRLFAPNAQTILKWFSTCYLWTSRHDNVERMGVSEAVLRSHCDTLLHHGDIRRIVTALETRNRLGANLSLDHDCHILNTFDASRRFLRGELSVGVWSTFTEPRDAALLQYHSSALAGDIDEIANCLDTFSLCDTMCPDRFELSTAQFPMTHFIQACAVPIQLPNRSRDVGALCLPPRIPRNSRLAEETQWDALSSKEYS